VFVDAEFTAPWCALARFGLSSAAGRLGKSDHVLFFHWLTEGECKVRLAGSTQVIDARAGDLILFPHDDQHVLGTDLRLAPVEGFGQDASSNTGLLHLRLGGGGATTRFVCGYVACHREVLRPLLEALPRVLRIPIGESPAAESLREVLRLGVQESAATSEGSASLRAKLAELLFVEALRRHAASQSPEARGWLAGIRDPQIGRALMLLHRDTDHDWSVDELARQVALSRSSLGERFTELVGESPMQYLIRLRLALAAQALSAGLLTIGQVAQRSGYESETAFTRAFKREFGVPPSAWRRSQSA
jgi:AraC-like DNA-binding protein